MASPFSLITLFSIVLFAGIIDAREYPGSGEIKQVVDSNADEATIQVMKQLFHIESALSELKKITTTNPKKSLVNDEFEPWPNVSAYGDDSKLKKEDKSFVKDFDPRPNVSAYGDDSKLKKEGKSFAKEFEPRPNVSAYGDDSKLKNEDKSFVKEFEPRPNVSAYGDDSKLQKKDKSFVKEFEPRPNVSAYGGGDAKVRRERKTNNADPCDHGDAVGPN